MDRIKIEAIDRLELEKFKSEKLRSLSWPLELQGKGETNEKDGTLRIRFPNGDIFLSLATTIHELGHLRQEEFDSTLKAEPQTHEALLAQERDAWERGWKRLLKGNPDFLKNIEAKFAAHKAKGKLKANESFTSLYEWIKKNLLKAVEVQAVLFENPEAKQGPGAYDRLADDLEKVGFRKFLEEYEKNRVGEKIDEEEMREFIKSILKTIIKE